VKVQPELASARPVRDLLVPSRDPRLLNVSREEKDLLNTVRALLAARCAAESRSKLICVSCGCTRPDDRDARRREHDRARGRTLMGTAASAAVLSVASGEPGATGSAQ